MAPWSSSGSVQKPWTKQQKWASSEKSATWSKSNAPKKTGEEASSEKRWEPKWKSSDSWKKRWKWSDVKEKYTVPDTFPVDKDTRYTGTVSAYYMWRGYGWITLEQQGVVPDNRLWVQWNNIYTEDRYPFLNTGMRVEFGIMTWREGDDKMSLRAKKVTLCDGKCIALQDALDAAEKTFVGTQRSRYTGKLKMYCPKRSFGWVALDEGQQFNEPVPNELRVDEQEVNAGGKRPWSWLESVVVEFGIHKLKSGKYRVYNMTLPGGTPLSEENLEHRQVVDQRLFIGEINYWNSNQGWGLIALDPSILLPQEAQVKLAEMQRFMPKQKSSNGGQPEKVIYFRKPDLGKKCWPKKGLTVSFQIYVDDKGLGAVDITSIDEENEDEGNEEDDNMEEEDGADMKES
eukprot:TRINITY_DN12968_c0_g1_i1.p1 TRINITY_DN12968_c0_g1~~TRINITY_DN12968_c0_g1_i1.p1  ORF type:complete len:401 (+),score=85.05 TRINITY_DN12968_c0_g1_i1:146-1348(+)